MSLVSTITPFYDAEAFLGEAVESVLAQTYTNWELLLVDDGSHDGSTDIARQYARKYEGHIFYLDHENHQNRGMSASRNLGIRQSRGTYVAFLDADDVWLPRKLETQVAILESNPRLMATFGPTLCWYSWTGKLRDRRRDSRLRIKVEPDRHFRPPDLLVPYLTGKALTPATCSVLLRRQAFERLGGFEEEFRAMYEDQVFFAKLYLKEEVFVHGEFLDLYRQHHGSSCAQAQVRGEYHPLHPNPSHYRFLQWLGVYLALERVADSKIWNAYQRALWPYRHPRLARFINPLRSAASAGVGGLHFVSPRLTESILSRFESYSVKRTARR